MPHIPHPTSHDLPSDVVLSVRCISKKFCRDLKRSMGYGVRDLASNLAGIRQNPMHLRKDEFWALEDVSFDVRRGDSVGLIGVNGSGKSTLFRIIHGIFPPDGGEICVRGKIGALIALGAGFHPHLSGRENIFLNASILGIPRKIIAHRFDDIVGFAEMEDFIDAPVATYSSGMKVRLGFAVAINIDPEILLIDEVLSVGDLAFRNKCVDKLKQLLSKERTIIFVSHNMSQVEHLCERAILLEGAKIAKIGSSGEVVAEYYRRIHESHLADLSSDPLKTGASNIDSNSDARFEEAAILRHGKAVDIIEYGSNIEVQITFQLMRPVQDPIVYLVYQTTPDVENVAFTKFVLPGNLPVGRRTIKALAPKFPLLPGLYRVAAVIKDRDGIQKHGASDRLFEFAVSPVADQFPKTREMGYVELGMDVTCA